MKVKKSLLVAGAVATMGSAGILGTHLVAAATNTSNDSLVDKIAQKFNLKTEDVQAVFDQNRADKQAERDTRIEQKLSQDVTAGKITADQKDIILAKLKELQANFEANRDALKDKTPAERKTAMDALHVQLDQWASDNNIPTQYLHMFGGHRRGMPGMP